MNDFLQKIYLKVKKRVSKMPDYPNVIKNKNNFLTIFENTSKPVIISEIKYFSPSLGRIYQGNFNPVNIASDYLSAGADALSVLTEPDYFKGNVDFIRRIRQKNQNAHLLLKDFVISKKQVRQAAYFGATAILLIHAMLSDELLLSLYQYALSLGITPIVEVHTLKELKAVSLFSPLIIGINNRSLESLKVNINISKALINHVPKNSYVISESGIKNASQIDELYALGFDGFLIGTSLMKNTYPGNALKRLISKEKLR